MDAPLKSNILVVDDQEANLKALEAILEPLGQRLLVAHSGDEALRHLLREPEVAVILLDVRMPGLDGYETARLIKQRERSRFVPILFLTGAAEDEAEIFRAYEHGAVDYIRKPLDPHVLRAKVRVFVELHERGAALRAQEALLREHELAALERRAEERYRTLLDAMPQCVWALGPDGEVLYASEGWRRYAGLARGETTLEMLRRFIHPEDLPVFDRVRRRAMDRVEDFEVQFRLRRAEDGVWRWHLGRGVPHREDGGRVLGWVITATDIDDQKRVEETLQQAELALRRANAAKDHFLAAASHELRTPLTVAKAQIGLALRKFGDTDARRALETIDRHVGRMARLVEDLLDLGRLESGRLSLEVEEFDAAELAREAGARMQLLSEHHRIEVRAPDRAIVRADRDRVDQVVTNLLSNAIRYAPDGGDVILTVERAGDRLHVAVRDHGIGIPPDRLEQIFDRYGMAHGDRYGGLGLGLAIAQGIVQQHGGRIWAESQGVEGEGSTFHVDLPARVAESAAASSAPVLVDDPGDDQKEGDQAQDVEVAAGLELRPDGRERDPVGAEHPERQAEDREEAVAALPPEA